MELSRTKRAIIALLIMVPIATLCLLTAKRICFSFTQSLPYRLFWLTAVKSGQEINVGEYVAFPAPKTYGQLAGVELPGSSKAIKQVKCKEGQTLLVEGRKFFCDNVLLGEAKEKTLSGKPLVPFDFKGIIPSGKLFVMGSHRDSYDSRYIGFIDRNVVESTGTPLL